ncbi:MAG TPA: hypothetical protein VM869_31965 [Enhygromyxa sp.]|nr:hypothetical protein [Enhygromyxa sp.]
MIALPRTLLIAALLGVIVACLGALWANGTATREAAAYELARRSIDELALLAGLADEQGKLLREEPMAVEVIADGGPLWVIDTVERAANASPWFTVGPSPHLLRAEIIDERGGVALQLHLWRGGWELREPQPRRVRIAAWAAVVAGLLGAVAAVYVRRISLGLAAAGVLAQILLALDPLPPELFPPQRLFTAWAEGPLFGPLFDAIERMSTLHVAAATAVVAACLVLVAFDHRRSRGRGGDLGLGWASVAALIGSLGAIAWIEAASRGSLFAACDLRFGAWSGYLALLGLIVAWLPAIRVAREAWRAQHAQHAS